MLCPEIWNFEPSPHFTATLHLDMIKLKKSDVPTVVKNHYFNHSVNNFFQNLASLQDFDNLYFVCSDICGTSRHRYCSSKLIQLSIGGYRLLSNKQASR